MRSFAFSLQSFLTFRSHLKERAAQACVRTLWELQNTTLECQRCLADLKSWQKARREQQADPLLAADLMRNNLLANEFYQRWMIQERLRQKMENRVKEALEYWEETRRKDEILERLKQRNLNAWTKERENQEQKLNDERASIMAFRRTQRQMTTHE